MMYMYNVGSTPPCTLQTSCNFHSFNSSFGQLGVNDDKGKNKTLKPLVLLCSRKYSLDISLMEGLFSNL